MLQNWVPLAALRRDALGMRSGFLSLRSKGRQGRTPSEPPELNPSCIFWVGRSAHDVDMPEIRHRHVVSCSRQASVRDWRGGGWKK